VASPQNPTDFSPLVTAFTNPLETLANWTQTELPSIGCNPSESKVLVLNFRMPEGVNEALGVQLADELSSAADSTNRLVLIPVLDRVLLKTYLRVGPTNLSMFQTNQQISRLANDRGACAVVAGKAERIEGNTFRLFVRMISAKNNNLAATTEITVNSRIPPLEMPLETINFSGGRMSRGRVSPACFYMPNPPYTEEARAAKFEGVILFDAFVQADGSVGNVKILESPGLGLNEQVLKAMSAWKCSPVIEGGEPRSTHVQFEINFRLPENQ
jgi:TonB family protein